MVTEMTKNQLFSTTPLLFDDPLQGTPTNIRISLILRETRVIEPHLRR